MDLEGRIQRVGMEIFERSAKAGSGFFDKGYWSGKMMDWAMQYPAFKVEMFRFVDVLPSLTHHEQVAEHIKQYFLREELDFPAVIRTGMGMATATGLTARIAAGTIRKNVEAMASTFITGENSASARGTLEKLWNNGFCFTVDILGEAVLSEPEAQDYQRRYMELIEGLAVAVREWKANPQLEDSPRGKVPRANVSVKCSALYSQLDNLNFRGSVDTVKERLRPLLRAAQKNGVFVNLDMEQNDYREMFLTVAEELFCEPEFAQYPHLGIVIQAYLKCAMADLERVIAWSGKRGTPITVRLVKGAYWDYETIQSAQRGWPCPVFPKKAATDANYERCSELLLRNHSKINAAFGSHNVRNLAFVLTLAEELKIPKNAFEIQMLFGMADSFKRALSQMGYRVRDYAPVGELLPGMAYLVRRLLENTANEGFLRATFVGKKEAATLLENPAIRANGAYSGSIGPSDKAVPTTQSDRFANEPLRDFSRADERAWIAPTLANLRKRLPLQARPQLGGEQAQRLTPGAVLESRNPCDSKEIICKAESATVEQVDHALKIASAAQKSWGQRPAAERIALVERVGELLRAHKNELTALITLETGKNIRESDADVAEAIDFCFYYAVQMRRLAVPHTDAALPGEANALEYRPRGVTVAIAPWNFPLAILCGMTMGPLVAGNPVLLKAAEQSSGIAWRFFEILREAGIPADAAQFIPGQGEVVGARMVQSPLTHVINFTGSRAVGLHIVQEAAKVVPGQRHIKRAVCEMGGKNAIYIDDDADLDEAVMGCLHSAFGFQGQKCSALSRILVHEACYDKFKERFKEAMLSLKIGPSEDLGAKVNAVIDADAHQRLLGVIERHRDQIVAQLPVPAALATRGYFVPPTLFESGDPKSELGQNEFFGPVVTLFQVRDLQHATEVFNDVDYALTGAIYSRSPEHLAHARAHFECGNLYINRGCTGALVWRQPFGGYKLSGVGAKAGGPDYLLQFLEPRSVTENTMRRGFAPETTT